MNIPSTWRLVKSSLTTQRRHLKPLLLIASLVAIPANLLVLLGGSETSISSYISLATLLMNLALIWAVIQLEDSPSVRLRQAYYQGTASFVRFILVSALVILMLVPLAIGLIVFNIGVLGAAPGTTGFEKIIMTIVAMVFAVPSLYWFNRVVLAPFVVVEKSLNPFAAIGYSWNLVKGNSWAVLVRLLGLALSTLLLLAVPTIALTFAYGKTGIEFLLTLLQIVVSLFVVPYAIIYLYKLRKALG